VNLDDLPDVSRSEREIQLSEYLHENLPLVAKNSNGEYKSTNKLDEGTLLTTEIPTR